MREFKTFIYRDASYRISPSKPRNLYEIITSEIIDIRNELEAFIALQPAFLSSLEPISLIGNAPDAAKEMAAASNLTGIGPMAGVAGTIAQLAAIRSINTFKSSETAEKQPEIIIENGGDIFILPGSIRKPQAVIAGIFSGLDSAFSSLALKIIPEPQGTALCSSSSRMGHSLSFGDCDLCTVISSNAALADAAATLGANLVKTEKDLGPAAERLAAITGVTGVLLIKNKELAMAGSLPELIRHKDSEGLNKITGKFLI